MPHTPTDMSKWWTGSSCKLCQKLVISPFLSEISDVPAGCLYCVEVFLSDENVTNQCPLTTHLCAGRAITHAFWAKVKG